VKNENERGIFCHIFSVSKPKKKKKKKKKQKKFEILWGNVLPHFHLNLGAKLLFPFFKNILDRFYKLVTI
jgi:hypothetical protein